ncbi:MAG: ferrochelatase [Pirellulaceae bacterium]|nr:ferrochelatase [Pirellulaceae bacterium]
MTTASATGTLGLLVMAYGGPDSLDDIAGFLADIRAGRPTPRHVLDEITENYRQIGGSSPLLKRSQEQVAALTENLASRTSRKFKTYLGMRHWAPWIEETVAEMLDDGIEQAVAIVLAPHYSSMSIAKYQGRVRDALELYRGHIDFRFVDSFFDHPNLIQAFAKRIRTGLTEWDEQDRGSVHVVMSAHSLPVRILKQGDPYPDQFQKTAELIAEACQLTSEQWSWCYQSAGRSPEPWLGPQLDEHLQTLAERNIKNVMSVPIGFVSDHVEIQFDIDINAQRTAQELGICLKRPPALNDDPDFIETLAQSVLRAAGDWFD